MCLIFVAYKHHPRYPLVVAANRDEFYRRPTTAADFWVEHPELLAGRDLEGGGTWLGISRSGRFAAVTNYREPGKTVVGAPSRGRLVTDFLLREDVPIDYLKRVCAHGSDYNGFNLLVRDDTALCWYSNRADGPRELSPGVYALSNHLLDTSWPKVARGKAGFESILAGKALDENGLLDLLADRTAALEEELPDTGVGPDLERVLSPIFINSENYGTRSSTVVTLDNTDQVKFVERRYSPAGRVTGTVAYEFPIASDRTRDSQSGSAARQNF
ncbi:MAG TPA: NRDE family protein [Gammaproteobacteria bacterium]|nr:NRDE family protein [Gammaproteobacteria bacterium]